MENVNLVVWSGRKVSVCCVWVCSPCFTLHDLQCPHWTRARFHTLCSPTWCPPCLWQLFDSELKEPSARAGLIYCVYFIWLWDHCAYPFSFHLALPLLSIGLSTCLVRDIDILSACGLFLTICGVWHSSNLFCFAASGAFGKMNENKPEASSYSDLVQWILACCNVMFVSLILGNKHYMLCLLQRLNALKCCCRLCFAGIMRAWLV